MPVYHDADHLYSVAQTLFSRIEAENPQAVRGLLTSRMLIRLSVQGPEAEIWVNARRHPIQTNFGPARQRPDLDVRVSGDTLHQILLGDLTLTRALNSGALRVTGPVWKAVALGDFFNEGQSIYPGLAAAHGLSP